MSYSQQMTLDGQVAKYEDFEEKALEKKVPTKFSKQIVYAKMGEEVVKGKKYQATFSSAPPSIFEILNEILKDNPATVKQWIATQKED